MRAAVRELLKMAHSETQARIEQGLKNLARQMSGDPPRSWDSPIVRTERSRLAASMADIAILEQLLGTEK